MDVPISASALASLFASRHSQHETLNFPPLSQNLDFPKTLVLDNYILDAIPFRLTSPRITDMMEH